MDSVAQQQLPGQQNSQYAQEAMPGSQQMNGGPVANNAQAVELDHAIGFSGQIDKSVYLHPNAKEYVMIAGCSIVTGDLNDPHSQHFLTAHDDLISCIAVSNMGQLLASGQKGDNSDVVIWDYNAKKAIFRLSEHDHAVSHLAFSHDDKLLISVGSQLDGKMFIWNTSNGYIVSSLQVTPTIFADGVSSVQWGGFVKDIKLRNTGNYQFAIAGSKKLTLWSLDPSAGSCKYEAINTGAMVRDYSCLAFSKPNEEFLFAGSKSGDFCSFQVKNKMFVFSQSVCAQGIKNVEVVTNDKICVGGGDGQVVLFHVDQNFCQSLMQTQLYGSISGLSSSNDGVQLLAATNKGFLYRIRVSDFSQMLLAENHTDPVINVSYMPEISDRFITCSTDGTIRLWDANDYSVKARCINPQAATAGIHPLCAMFTDEIILSGWSDGRIRAYRCDNQQLLWQIDNAHKNGVTAIGLSNNYKFIVSGGNEGEIRVWEIRSRELIAHLKEHTSKVTKVQIFADDVHLLSSSRDKSILCWDLKNQKRISNQTLRMGGINCFAISPTDTNLFMSVGQDRKITYWDIRKSQAQGSLESSPNSSESDELLAIDIDKTGRYFATGGLMGIARIYDYQNGQFITDCRAHSNAILSLKFSPDGKQIVTTGQDGLIAIWNVFL